MSEVSLYVLILDRNKRSVASHWNRTLICYHENDCILKFLLATLRGLVLMKQFPAQLSRDTTPCRMTGVTLQSHVLCTEI